MLPVVKATPWGVGVGEDGTLGVGGLGVGGFSVVTGEDVEGTS